jgi:hypothetical protein
LSSTARAVPERRGGLVRRRPRPRDYHARESYDPDKPSAPDQFDKPCATHEFCDTNEFCGANEFCHAD